MALPPSLMGNFTTLELEFLTEDELISIVPNVAIPTLHLIGGTYGPFRPGRTFEIPLWLAILLKQKQKIEINLPNWLTLDNLKKRLEEEKQQDFFTTLPFHYIELSQLILPWVDLEETIIDETREKLKNIREIRQNKVREGIQSVNSQHLQVDNISHMELNLIRPMLSKSFQHLSRMEEVEENPNP